MTPSQPLLHQNEITNLHPGIKDHCVGCARFPMSGKNCSYQCLEAAKQQASTTNPEDYFFYDSLTYTTNRLRGGI